MLTNSQIEEIFRKIIIKKQQVCVFGTGKVATGKGIATIRLYGGEISCFFDNNQSKWGQVICDNIKCLPITELHEYKDAFFFVMVGGDGELEIKNQLELVGANDIVLFSDIGYSDRYVDYVCQLNEGVSSTKLYENTNTPLFFGEPISNEKKKKIAYYTCITGGYDKVKQPQCLENDVIDYYLITDEKDYNDSVFKVLDVSDIVPEISNDNIRINRFCKILGCDIFSNYKYSIYVDGSYLVRNKVSQYTEAVGGSGIAIRREDKYFDCIYQQGAWAIEKFSHGETIINQMQRYYNEGMPRHWGSYACGCMVRDNSNGRLRTIMREWWNEVYCYSFRDQVSFAYVLWKHGIQPEDIGILEGDFYNNDEMELVDKHR